MTEIQETENVTIPTGMDGALATVSARSEADRAAALYAQTPDIRSDRVAEMRARLAAGKLEVSAAELADAILREARLTRLGRT